MTIQSNKNLNYLIDPKFTKANRLFVLLFERIEENNIKKDKRFQCFKWWKSLFDLPVKNEEEAYGKITRMSRSNDYTIGNLLNFGYFKENFGLIAIGFGK